MNNNFSATFHDLLMSRIRDKKRWAQEIASTLNLSTDAIYKKARHETSYSLSEFMMLSDKYDISYDQIVKGSEVDFIKIKTPFLNSRIKSPMEYLKALEKTFSSIQSSCNPKILYTTRELPIFYYFLNPHLTAFKLFVFAKTVWEIPLFKNSVFDLSLFDPETFVLAKNIWNHYADLISEEFWTLNVFDVTIQQLQYFKDLNQIKQEDIDAVLVGIENVILQCHEMSESKSKNIRRNSNNFFLYENKILHTSNHILVQADEIEFMYLTYDNPNYIYTQDKEFINYSKDWYNKIKKNSYSLGDGSGHLRFKFFEELKKKVREFN